MAFYSKVFGYEMKIDTSGPNPMADLVEPKTPQGPSIPARSPDGGNTIHLGLPDSLEAGIARCQEAGERS